MGHIVASDDILSIHQDIPGALSLLECMELADAVAGASPLSVLEVGHYLGRSTAVILSSLPMGARFWTVDHHRGDQWAPETEIEDFCRNVEPWRAKRHDVDFLPVYEDCEKWLLGLPEAQKFDLVFYDADHRAAATVAFWDLIRDRLSRRCVFIYDDADWPGSKALELCARSAGYISTRRRELVRNKNDKQDPDTYTLEILSGQWNKKS